MRQRRQGGETVGRHAEHLNRLFKALGCLDLARVAELCAEDCVYEDVPYPEATVIGP